MAAKKVLIVEDDAILAGALAGAVKKAGYTSLVCARPEDALHALDQDSFKIVFIDCLLPQTPGVDLARVIRKNFDARILPIVMMSGVFTDKQMMKEIVQEISAVDFLKKPFEVNEVLRFLEKESTATHDGSLSRSLFSLPDRVGASPNQAQAIFQDINRVHGYELPLLLSAAVTNGYTGVVHLLSDKDEKNKVSFQRGAIAAVECTDVQSFMGKILVAQGWVLPEDLDKALQSPHQSRKIGEQLIASNAMSPHAIFEALEEQMAMRLAKLLQDQYYVVKFEERPVEIREPSIEPEQFYRLLDHLISTRIPGDWLNQHLVTWQDYTVRFGPSHDRNRREYVVKSVEEVQELISSIERTGSLSDLLQSYTGQATNFARAFYYLLCMHFVLFAEKVPQMSEAERNARLQKLWTQMKDLNLLEVFQMIGGRKDMDAREVRNIVGEFVQRHLGPSPKEGTDPSLRAVFDNVRGKISASYELFLDPQKLQRYEVELEHGKVSQRTEALAKADEAKKMLSMRQYSQALVVLKKATELYPKLDYLVLYTVWAKVGLFAASKTKGKDLAEIDQLMARVPSEEKISAIGNFIQGLLAKAKGETANARKFFETALTFDKALIEARRELNAMGPVPGSETKKPVDLLHGDLSQVLGSFFKKS